MKLIALETAVSPGSLAALEIQPGSEPSLTAIDLPKDRRTAEILAPLLKELLAKVGWPTGEIDAVGLTVGPGSFTGLRLGVTTAKTLAYAAGADCVPLNTLAVLAAQAVKLPSGWAVLDAQRQELFAARISEGALTSEPTIIPQAEWLSQLNPDEAVIGPVLTRIADQLPEGALLPPESAWRPQAQTVAELAVAAFEQGKTVSPFDLLPKYYRLSAAEEKLPS